MTSLRKVLVTGACGYVAQRMWPELLERYDVCGIDARQERSDGSPVSGIERCDLSEDDREVYRHLFKGVDCVIHCAFIAPSGSDSADWSNNTEAKFRAEHRNVAMAYNVYQTALEEGVRRVVVASSNHAADYYERLIWAHRFDTVTPDLMPLSDNYYGWAKSAYELLGFVFATGKVGGRKLENVQLRIGGPRDNADLDGIEPGDIKRMHRGLGAYLSRRDQVQLFTKSVEAENIEDDNGIPFQVFYGVSGNTHNFWSITSARKVIGYAPEDNSQVNFAAEIARLAGAQPG